MTTAARRRSAVTISPRRYAVSRAVTFGPALVLPLAAWVYLRELAWLPVPAAHAAIWHAAGLAVMIAAGLLIWPAFVVSALFFLPAALSGGLVRRKWRIAYRQRHGRDSGCPCWIHTHIRASGHSAYISAGLRRVVTAADRGRCVACGNGPRGPVPVAIQVDHGRPWAGGGLTTLLNCFILCQVCNLVKLNYWRDRDGYEHYANKNATTQTLATARKILRRERLHRWNPLRLMRAAWALG